MLVKNVHFTVQYAYLREGKRVFSFCFKNQKYFHATVMNIKSKTSNHFTKPVSLFQKQKEGEESLFLKEKQEAHLYANALYFFKFLKHKQI